ncbi:MAG: type 4a pilus biogenesis protein PilO [Thermodesulfobacterium sp.]|nr:type 4a pilus biogenesis protein PilO [Thermodesulfobacterium sp.]
MKIKISKEKVEQIIQRFKKVSEKLRDWEETATKREKTLLFIISIILPLFLFYKFYFVDVQEKIKILKEEVNRLNMEIAKYEKIAQEKEILERKLEKRREFLGEIQAILPKEKEIPDLLKEIAQKGKKSGLEILVFQPGSEIQKDYYNIIPLDVEVKGSFENILTFFNEVENMPRLVILNSAHIESREGDPNLVVKSQIHTFKYTGVEISKKK